MEYTNNRINFDNRNNANDINNTADRLATALFASNRLNNVLSSISGENSNLENSSSHRSFLPESRVNAQESDIIMFSPSSSIVGPSYPESVLRPDPENFTGSGVPLPQLIARESYEAEERRRRYDERMQVYGGVQLYSHPQFTSEQKGVIIFAQEILSNFICQLAGVYDALQPFPSEHARSLSIEWSVLRDSTIKLIGKQFLEFANAELEFCTMWQKIENLWVKLRMIGNKYLQDLEKEGIPISQEEHAPLPQTSVIRRSGENIEAAMNSLRNFLGTTTPINNSFFQNAQTREEVQRNIKIMRQRIVELRSQCEFLLAKDFCSIISQAYGIRGRLDVDDDALEKFPNSRPDSSEVNSFFEKMKAQLSSYQVEIERLKQEFAFLNVVNNSTNQEIEESKGCAPMGE